VSQGPHATETGKRLCRVETLLDLAIENVIGGNLGRSSECATALAEASAELQTVKGQLTEQQPKQDPRRTRLEELDRAALLRQLGNLPARLQSLERLLAAAAEFYRGWCAAAPPQSGYEVAGCLEARGPALLALEG
jgi:hypothetical protein